MKHSFASDKFSKSIMTKRIILENMNMREAGKEIGISPATLSRYENGRLPDIINYAKICTWLGVQMNFFIKRK